MSLNYIMEPMFIGFRSVRVYAHISHYHLATYYKSTVTKLRNNQ